MTTFPILEKAGLDEKQKVLWDELTLGPRSVITGGPGKKRMPDLFNAWLHFPEFGHLALRLADAIRANEALTHKLRELVVLTTSMLLNTRVEYDFHVPLARKNGLPDAVKASLLAQIPLGRLGAAEEVAHAVCFLASREAAYITGTELHVNGGMHMA